MLNATEAVKSTIAASACGAAQVSVRGRGLSAAALRGAPDIPSGPGTPVRAEGGRALAFQRPRRRPEDIR
eukprot:1706210-Pyramimonas_sp.AAC.1